MSAATYTALGALCLGLAAMCLAAALYAEHERRRMHAAYETFLRINTSPSLQAVQPPPQHVLQYVSLKNELFPPSPPPPQQQQYTAAPKVPWSVRSESSSSSEDEIIEVRRQSTRRPSRVRVSGLYMPTPSSSPQPSSPPPKTAYGETSLARVPPKTAYGETSLATPPPRPVLRESTANLRIVVPAIVQPDYGELEVIPMHEL